MTYPGLNLPCPQPTPPPQQPSGPKSEKPSVVSGSPIFPERQKLSPHNKLNSSSKLNRWSRARAIQSRRKVDRSGLRVAHVAEIESGHVHHEADEEEVRDFERDRAEELSTGKSIYVVSDGTGWTAEQSVSAALGQFEHCLVDRACPVNTHLFSGIDDGESLMEIIKQAAKEGALVAYTLADPSMAETARQACKVWNIPSMDILGPIIEAVASHLGVSPSGLPRGAPGRNFPLSEEYFKRIEAIEFTIKQDDGALPQNLDRADIVLTGVSRTGKTPLSIYLAQKGYKVANVPIVLGIELPKALFVVSSEKVFALTISPAVLQTIRKSRAKAMVLGGELRTNYTDMDHVRMELEIASKIFAQNPVWPVIDITGKAIEEIAAVVLRLYHDRMHKCSMPRISKRY